MKNVSKKLLLTTGLMLAVSPLVTIPTMESAVSAAVEQGKWENKNNAWYYKINGVPAKGWVYDAGFWYYLNSSGHMATGWIQEGSTWYYLQSNGAMKTGWHNDGSAWYYLKSNGAMATAWIQDAGNWFYLNAAGQMKTGWLYYGGDWYYLNSEGVMQTGWLYDHGKWYFLNPAGDMHTGKYMSYYFNESGEMLVGKHYLTGYSYHLGTIPYTEGFYYHFKENGRMTTDEYVDGEYYWKNGILLEDKEFIDTIEPIVDEYNLTMTINPKQYVDLWHDHRIYVGMVDKKGQVMVEYDYSGFDFDGKGFAIDAAVSNGAPVTKEELEHLVEEAFNSEIGLAQTEDITIWVIDGYLYITWGEY
ncbi:hypothetical protein FZW96_07435 [Bacillus sp. BGMRC 2118]|nr:hypothetical protein FZW96_07435 [Bacillus sp. BGMRC 2118]